MDRKTAPEVMKEWMRRMTDTALEEGDFETSAGAGPGRDYAYLHFRHGDEHSILVLRAVLVDGRPEVRAFCFEGPPEEVARLTNAATHGDPDRAEDEREAMRSADPRTSP